MRGMSKVRPRGILTLVVLVAVSLFVGSFPVDAAQPQKLSRGETLFRNHCVGCHSIRCNRNGPKLLDLIGRRAGSVEDFGYYSAELKDSGIVWSEERLSEFLSNPGKLVPGTKMTTVSIKDPKERRDIIGFIKRQDTSVDLCF